MLRLRGMRNSQDGATSKPPSKNDENNENAGHRDTRLTRKKANRPPLGTLVVPNAATNDKNTQKSKKRPLDEYKKSSISHKRRDYSSFSEQEERPQNVEQLQESVRKSVGIAYPNSSTTTKPANSAHAIPRDEHRSTSIHHSNMLNSIPTSTHAKEEFSLPEDGMVPSLFATARGGSLRVSAAKVMSYEAELSRQVVDDGSVGQALQSETNPSRCQEDVTGSAPGVVVSLFQTGRGTQVKISEAKVREYAAKLVDAKDVENDLDTMQRKSGGEAASSQYAPAAPPSGEHNYNDATPQTSAAVARPSTHAVVSLFQSGTGRAIQISAEKAQAYAQTLFATTDDDTAADDRMAVPQPTQSKHIKQGNTAKERNGQATTPSQREDRHSASSRAMDEGGNVHLVESLFTSGNGRPLKISADKAKTYARHLFADLNEEEMLKPSPVTSSASQLEPARHRLTETRSDLSQRDEANERHVESRLQSHFSGTLEPNTAKNHHIVSLFTSGKGEPLKIALAKAKAYEQRLFEDDHETPAPKNEASSPSVAKPFSEVSTGALKQRSLEHQDDFADVNNSVAIPERLAPTPTIQRPGQQPPVVTSLFTSGRGQPCTISMDKVQAYERSLFGDSTMDECQDETHATDQGTLPLPHKQQHDDQVMPRTRIRRQLDPTPSFDGAMTMNSMFQTGSGRHVTVSVEKVEMYHRLHVDQAIDEDVGIVEGQNDTLVDKTAVSSVQSSTSRSEMDDRTTYKPHPASADDGEVPDRYRVTEPSQHGTAMHTGDVDGTTPDKEPTMMESLFATGSGRQVVVSMEPARAFEEAMHPPSNAVNLTTSCDLSTVLTAPAKAIATAAATRPTPSHPLSSEDVAVPTNVTPPPPMKPLHPSLPLKAMGQGKQVSTTAPPRPNRKAFKAPRKLIKPFSSNVQLEKPLAPPKPPVPVAAVPFSVAVSELWDFSSLATSPNAFNPYPFESAITSICATNAHLVQFNHLGRPELVVGHGDGMTLSAVDLYQYMVSQRHLLPSLGASFAWFANHFRWIVLKCAAMERAFVAQLFGKYCTQAQVAFQLSRRFHRELENAERPALTKIYQRDAHAGNAIVLFVAAVYPTHVVLSDGWYSMAAVPDSQLAAKFTPTLCGSKLVVWNATLVNNAEGIHPLEARVNQIGDSHHGFDQFDKEKDPYLALHVNSTRRVHWSTKLGMERPSLGRCMLQSLPLRSLKQDGGLVRSVRCVVLRASELLVLQPKESTQGPRVVPDKDMQNMRSSDMMPRPSTDAATTSPAAATAAPVPFMRLRVACSHGAWTDSNTPPAVTTAVLTLWRPSEETQIACKEGSEIFATSVAVSWKQKELNLSSSKHTSVRRAMDGCQTAQAFVGYEPRKALTAHEIQHMCGQDVDICVCILHVTNEYAIATDATWTVLCVKLPRWGAKAWKPNAVLCLRNVFVSHYDSRLDVLDCAMTDMSTFLSSPPPTSYFSAPFASLKAAMQEQQPRLRQLLRRVRATILNDPQVAAEDVKDCAQQGATDIPHEPEAQATNVHCVTGHAMHMLTLPEPLDDRTHGPLSALLFVDTGAHVVEIFIPAPLSTQVADHVASLAMVRVQVQVGGVDEVLANSCRSWEALDSSSVCRVVAAQVDVVAATAEVQRLLQRLS